MAKMAMAAWRQRFSVSSGENNGAIESGINGVNGNGVMAAYQWHQRNGRNGMNRNMAKIRL
jgi:hypothetical protein